MNKKIAVIGGDIRTVYAAKELVAKGYGVAVFGFDIYSSDMGDALRSASLRDAVVGACAVMLPIPYSLDGEYVNAPFSKDKIPVSKVCSLIADGKILLGGCFDKGFAKKCLSCGIKVCDYFEREDLKILNAVPTAEGAVAIAMQETDSTIRGAKCTVISYGKVGEELSRMLIALGAEVTVAARKSAARAKAYAAGCKAVCSSELISVLKSSDIVFNAAPAPVIGKEELSVTKKNVLLIDLASKPGGIDFDCAKELGRKAVWALSLPNKAAPVTAGQYLAYAVDNVIRGVD